MIIFIKHILGIQIIEKKKYLEEASFFIWTLHSCFYFNWMKETEEEGPEKKRDEKTK